MVDQPFEDPTPSDGFAAKILTFGGGKGGIGKSFLSAGVSAALAQRGARVLLVDMDLGGANLHGWLGMPPPREHDLGSFLRRGGPDLEEIITPTSVEGLSMIQGATTHLGAANLKYVVKLKVMQHLRRLPYEWIIVDLGAGSSYNTLDFFLFGTRGLLVVTPEKTSIENSYRFLRAAMVRAIRGAAKHNNFVQALREVEADASKIRTVPDLVDRLVDAHPQAERIVRATLRRMRVSLVVNQVWDMEEIRLARQMKLAVHRHLGVDLTFLGPVRHSEEVVRALRHTRNPVLEVLRSEIPKEDLLGLVDRLLRDSEYELPAAGGAFG